MEWRRNIPTILTALLSSFYPGIQLAWNRTNAYKNKASDLLPRNLQSERMSLHLKCISLDSSTEAKVVNAIKFKT